MNKIWILSLLLLIISCKKSEPIKLLRFIPDEDNLELKQKFKKFNNQNLHCLGSYEYNGNPIVTSYIFKKEYNIDIIKIENLSNDFIVEDFPNQMVGQPGFYNVISDSYYELLYDSRINSDIKQVRNIKLISNDKITKISLSDTVKEYVIESNKFSLKINDNNDKTIYFNNESQNNIVTFVKSKSTLFIFIFISLPQVKTMDKDLIQLLR